MEAKPIDGILLTGLHNKLPIDEILRQAAQAAGIELCLYSAELEIFLQIPIKPHCGASML